MDVQGESTGKLLGQWWMEFRVIRTGKKLDLLVYDIFLAPCPSVGLSISNFSVYEANGALKSYKET